MITVLLWTVGALLGAVFFALAGYFLAWRQGEQRVLELNDGWMGFLQDQRARWNAQWRAEMAARDTAEYQATPTPAFPPLTTRPLPRQPSRPLSRPLAQPLSGPYSRPPRETPRR